MCIILQHLNPCIRNCHLPPDFSGACSNDQLFIVCSLFFTFTGISDVTHGPVLGYIQIIADSATNLPMNLVRWPS